MTRFVLSSIAIVAGLTMLETESAEPAADAESTSLFNGQDLTGWHVDVPYLDNQAGRLIVRDNGIGMSDDDLRNYLATIGGGLTRLSRGRYRESSIDSLIGKFGVGFLSCFFVADRVMVETRKRGYPGYRWKSQGGREYTIAEAEELSYGTTVAIDLSRNVQREWNEDAIGQLVLESARHFAFPIFLGETGKKKLTDLEATCEIRQSDRSEVGG